MRRREFVLGAAGLVVSPAVIKAQGLQRVSVVRPKRVLQECPQWCWAASASMIFSHLGHSIDQKKIVAAVFHGGLDCSAVMPKTITDVLNAPWIDDSGQQFRPHVTAGYDHLAGINEIGFGAAGNTFIVNELQQNRMLLHANTHHCMALVEVDYFDTPMGPNIVNAIVLDPFPPNPPEHPLPRAEGTAAFAGGQMMYLAAVRI
jgi:papain like cysteine protease AvrRpt2